ncbi:hypothetical protein Tco_0170179 [Tanacetum coccineum]
MYQEKVQQEKLKAVKARLNFEETSQHSESGAPSKRMDVKKRLRPKYARNMSRIREPRPDRSRSHRRKDPERETVFRRLEKGVFHRLGDKEKGISAYSGTEPAPKRHHDRKAYSRKGGRMPKSEDSAGGHWKSKSKKQRSSMEDEDLSQHGHVKTYDGSEDPEDHLKIFQAAAKVERWAMPTCYDDLKEAFLANYLQQKKCIKDPVEIHHIKQREGESTEDFVRRFKIESRDVKGALEVGYTTDECMHLKRQIEEMLKAGKLSRLEALNPTLSIRMVRLLTFCVLTLLKVAYVPDPGKLVFRHGPLNLYPHPSA